MIPTPTSHTEEPHAYGEPLHRKTTRRTRAVSNSGKRPPHQPPTPPCAPPASVPPMTTPPPPRDSDHPPPQVWCTVLEPGHYYVVAPTATSSGPQLVIKGTNTMLAPGAATPGAVGDSTTPLKRPQGRLQAGGPSPGPRPGPNQLGAGGLLPRTCHALPVPVDQARLAIHRDRALDLGHPRRPHTS